VLGCPWRRAIPNTHFQTPPTFSAAPTHTPARKHPSWLLAPPGFTHTPSHMYPLQHQYLAQISSGCSGDFLLLAAAAAACAGFSGELLPPADVPFPFWPPTPSLAGLSALATAATVEPTRPSVSAPCMTLSR
jgi:hypothetical protein